jgi:ribosome-associated protein
MTTESETPKDDRAIAVACAQFSLEKKARDVRLLFVGDRLGIAEYFVLATVNNRRQARAVRDGVRLGLKGLGFGVPQAASEDPDGRWSLYDYGGVVLHMFDDEGREYFDLDSIWADVPEIEVVDSLSTASAEGAADTEEKDG